MKVVIITEGGGNIGFGHVSRSLSLYHAFEARGVKPKLLVNGDDSIKDLLQGTDHRVFDWLKDSSTLAELLSDANIAIVDSYLAGFEVYQLACNRAKLGVYFDDKCRLDYPAGVVINAAVNAAKINYPRKDNITYLLGVSYLTLRKEFWHLPEKTVRNELQNVLITFGAGDPRNLTARTLSMLCRDYPALTKNVVVGQWFSGMDHLSACADDRTNFIHAPKAERMAELMFDADIAISAGGQTLCELAKVGVPTIAFSMHRNEEWNLKGWGDVGFIIPPCMDTDDDFPEKIREQIDALKPCDQRRRRSEISTWIMNSCGAGNVVKTVIARLNKPQNTESSIEIRRATKADCYDLWVWRNHPDMRKWCFNTREIEYENHEKWFADNLDNPNTVMYICLDAIGLKIGQACFDVKESSVFINVNLNPLYFGRGLGSRMIEAATKLFLSAGTGPTAVTAEISADNVAACKAFAKAGYLHAKNVTKDGSEMAIYCFSRK